MDLVKNWDWEQKPVSCSEIIEILLWQSLKKLNHTLYSSHSRVSRIHQLLSPNPLPLFNSSSPATAQKPLPPIRHICGLGASVGCERIKRTFNTPRLKSQICLIGSNGFVCSSLNELNSKFLLHFVEKSHIVELEEWQKNQIFVIIWIKSAQVYLWVFCFE